MPSCWALSPVSWKLLPVLGPVLGAIPPLGVALVTDPGKTPWVLVAAVLMQQAENYLLVPRIMDKSVGVHPMVTLLAIAAFGSVIGAGRSGPGDPLGGNRADVVEPLPAGPCGSGAAKAARTRRRERAAL